MLPFKEAVKFLEKSKEFKDWKKKNPEAYLSYGFYMVEEDDCNWKIGYYHKSDDKVTSFNVDKKKVMIEPEKSHVVKQNETSSVREIEIKNVKLDLAEAVTIANELQKEEYESENPTKIIAILQNAEIGEIWNVTFLTQNLNTLNIKIKADTGRVVDKKLDSIMSLGKVLK